MNNILHNTDYLKTLVTLKERILQAQYKSYSAVNSEMILAYLDIGKIISIKTKTGWVTSVIKQLSVDLRAEFIGVKGYKAKGKRISTYDIISVEFIEPIEEPEVEETENSEEISQEISTEVEFEVIDKNGKQKSLDI